MPLLITKITLTNFEMFVDLRSRFWKNNSELIPGCQTLRFININCSLEQAHSYLVVTEVCNEVGSYVLTSKIETC